MSVHQNYAAIFLFELALMVATFEKLVKTDGKAPDDLEKQVATALSELGQNSEIKAQLSEVYFVGAQEYDFGNKKCILIWIPVPQLRDYQKIHPKLVRELEKKMSGCHIIFIAKRRILPKPQRGKNRKPLGQKRPRSRTLTAVHDAILSDIVFPAEVVGKRTRVKLDGKQIIKVHLDKAQQTTVEHKVDTFSHLYKRLTGKDVVFEFPEPLF
uniref:40S ribosomal protein S7 n=1 Tax=Globodera rostochiensis TaxID=31243 RepID=A0A914IA21_GLORO